MVVKGKAFEGIVDYEVTDEKLRSCTGNSNMSCITQFRPVVFPYARMVYKLLLALHSYNLCCFATGTYALLVGGHLDVFDGISIFIAVTDTRSTPILNWLFQKFEKPPALHFAIDNDFSFDLLNRDDANMDLFHYRVRTKEVLFRCLLWAFIVPSIAAKNPTLIWSTLCGKISSVSVTKNLQLPSHLVAPRQSPN